MWLRATYNKKQFCAQNCTIIQLTPLNNNNMTATTSVRLNVWMFAVISITFKCYSSNQIKRGPPQLQEIQKMTGPYFYGIRIR